MAALIAGLISTFAVPNRVAKRRPWWIVKVVAVASLALWFTVAAARRRIGTSG